MNQALTQAPDDVETQKVLAEAQIVLVRGQQASCVDYRMEANEQELVRELAMNGVSLTLTPILVLLHTLTLALIMPSPNPNPNHDRRHRVSSTTSSCLYSSLPNSNDPCGVCHARGPNPNPNPNSGHNQKANVMLMCMPTFFCVPVTSLSHCNPKRS